MPVTRITFLENAIAQAIKLLERHECERYDEAVDVALAILVATQGNDREPRQAEI